MFTRSYAKSSALSGVFRMTLGMPGGQGKAHFDSGEGQRATRGSVQHLMHQISAGVFAHLKQCVLVIYLTCTPFRWRLRAAQPMSCDAPDYRFPSKAKMARRRRPQREGAPEKRRSLLRQKPASLGFLAHGGPGERQMREQMLQMRAAAAAASASRQALARRPRPTADEEARLEASIHDYTKQAIEEAGDSSTVSCWSGDDRSSEVVMELGHGTDDDTLGVSSPVSDFDFEATTRVAQHPWEEGGAGGAGVGDFRAKANFLRRDCDCGHTETSDASRGVTTVTILRCLRLLALQTVCCRALPPGSKGCNHVLQRDVRCRIPPPPHPRRPSPPPPDHHPDYYHYHYWWLRCGSKSVDWSWRRQRVHSAHWWLSLQRLRRESASTAAMSLGHFEVPREQLAVRMASKEAKAMELGPRRKVRLDHGKRAEAKLFALLQRLSPSERQFALQSFNQAQRLALERWILAKRAGESSRPSPAERNRSLAGRASCRPSQKGRHGKSGMAGLHLHQRGQKQYYRASVVAGPFCLKTGLTQGADKARRFLEALLRIRARVLTSLLQEPACTEQGLEALEVAFRSAIQEELTGLGSGRLYFYANIPASYWVGQALTTPHFPVHGGGLDHGLWTQEATTPLSKGHAAKKKIEDEMADKAPGSIKPFFPCCGGPVGTMEKCICMVPADQQEQAKKKIEDEMADKAPGSIKPFFPCCGVAESGWAAKEKYKNI
eukprot:s1840_g16.t1